MKTEITIDGITYRVGDVLEQNQYDEHRITAIGELGIVAITTKNIDSYSSPEIYMSAKTLKNWKIKKPKKKIVVERWINVYRWRFENYHIENYHTENYHTKESADKFARQDRIACEYVKFEYEIDDN